MQPEVKILLVCMIVITVIFTAAMWKLAVEVKKISRKSRRAYFGSHRRNKKLLDRQMNTGNRVYRMFEKAVEENTNETLTVAPPIQSDLLYCATVHHVPTVGKRQTLVQITIRALANPQVQILFGKNSTPHERFRHISLDELENGKTLTHLDQMVRGYMARQ